MDQGGVYKACDIRGSSDGEMTPALYESWGRHLGSRIEAGEAFAVGGDVRQSTPEYLEALSAGLSAGGAQVVQLGIAPTPMIYFGRRHLGARGCAVVTASHSPPHINGLKWMVGPHPPDEAEVELMRRPAPAPRAGGGRTHCDIEAPYLARLVERWKNTGPLRLVVDPGHGCWAGRATRYLQTVYPGAVISALHDVPDGHFPERNPDCSRPRYLTALGGAVRQGRADLGVAFDGDGDRVAVVDDEGVALSAEEATAVLLDSFGTELAGRTFVHDIKFSTRIAEAAAALDAVPRAQRSGHAFIRRMMLDEDARFGAEISGHYFDAELDGGDDGLFTACRLISYLAGRSDGLSALRRACPAVFMTPDLRLALSAERQEAALDAVRTAFADRPQSEVDGVRVQFARGWALVRRSVTEPVLTCRFEGYSRTDLDETISMFCSALPDLGPMVAEQYRREPEEETP